MKISIDILLSVDAEALTNAPFGEGTGAIVLNDVRCHGNETSISLCRFSIPTIATHSGDAGVRCEERKLCLLILMWHKLPKCTMRVIQQVAVSFQYEKRQRPAHARDFNSVGIQILAHARVTLVFHIAKTNTVQLFAVIFYNANT